MNFFFFFFFFFNLIKRENKNNNLVKTSFISLFSVAKSMGIKTKNKAAENTKNRFLFIMKHKIGMNSETFFSNQEIAKVKMKISIRRKNTSLADEYVAW